MCELLQQWVCDKVQFRRPSLSTLMHFMNMPFIFNTPHRSGLRSRSDVSAAACSSRVPYLSHSAAYSSTNTSSPVCKVGVQATHIWGSLGTGLCKGLDDAGVDVEEVVTGHARFSGNTSWDDDQLGACNCTLQILLASVALDLWQHTRCQLSA